MRVPGLSYLPIAALVIGLPIPLVLSRLLAARHDRLQLGLLRNLLRGNLLPHWLQLVNMLVLCGLLASTLFTGAYGRRSLRLRSGHLPGVSDRIARWLGRLAAHRGGATEACTDGI
jgi:hypothetical protein